LGKGANVLVRDEGCDAAVIRLSGPEFETYTLDPPFVHAAAGADFQKMVRRVLDHELEGLERLAGVPGTLGGIIRMNAGGRYGEIGEFAREVRLIEADGRVATRSAAQVGFRYRHTDLDGCVVLAATLELRPGARDELRERYRSIWSEKYAHQPPVAARSAGCIFKNPPGRSAGKLIDEAGLKGHRVGGAEISTIHANFIVAHPDARAADVLDLIKTARARVQQTCGVELELEIEVW
jgi:UDP-N-acetylmuramate dehydrogenase